MKLPKVLLLTFLMCYLHPAIHGKALRKDHLYLWQGHDELRKLDALDALEDLTSYVDAADTGYFKSLIHLKKGYLAAAKKAIKKHASVSNHHYPYETKILLGLASSNVYYQAYGHFLDAITLNPKRVEGYIEKIRVLSDQKDYLAGIDHANEAVRLFPDHLELRVFRGNLYVYEGLTKRAFRDFKRVIDSEKPLSDYYMAQAHRGLAWAYLGREDVIHAEIHLAESLIIVPDHPFSSGLLAEIRFLQGDAKGALDAFESIRGTENKERYYLMIALAHEEIGHKEKACELFKTCCSREIALACKKLKELGCEP